MSASLTQSVALTATQKNWVLVGVGLGVLMSTLDVGIINVALPTLVQVFHTTFPTAQWTILGYQLISSGFVLGVTRLGDIWSKKPLYLTGLMVFTVSSLLIVPFFLEGVMHYPTLKVGLLLAVSPVMSGLIAPLAGSLSDRFGSHLIGLLGLGLMIGACLGISALDGQQSELDYIARFVLFGTGLGLFRSPNDSTVMGAVPRDRLGIASGLLSLSRTSGVMVGVPLMGAVFAAISASVAPGTDVATAPTAAIIAGFQGTFRLAALVIATAAIATAIGKKA